MLGNSLQNKKIIISAGASGIGWATTKICLSRGAIVYLCDIDNKSLNKIQKHPLNNKRLFSYECDASDEGEVSNFFSQVCKKTKKIDALINNVGVAGPTGTIEKLSSDDWEQTLKINVVSHFYFTKLAIPMLKKNKKPENAEKWILDSLEKKKLIMGFGHRVYNKGDSRVPTMKKYYLKVAELLNKKNLPKMSQTIEDIMLEKKIFIQMWIILLDQPIT